MPDNHQEFTCLSWNIHRCRGNDGRIDPARTLATLRDDMPVGAIDALILQEADEEVPPHSGLLDIAAVEAATGLRYLHTDPAHRWSDGSHGFLGTIMFTRPEIAVESITLLDLPGRCHRGAVIADLTRNGQEFRLVGMHLSLMQTLRWAQLRTICQFMFRKPRQPAILMGDLNEWRPWGGLALSKRFLGAELRGPAKATFPINRPMLPLDRVLTTAPAHVSATQVLDGPGIRMTSDHRPLLAHISLGG
ncbi:endonuclease/exonuclease/phosphatase family protein [Roseobacter sp. CCS2]|uniref:endonuclease/exonuclease/phosphatase family protein n=1 Tax=Roseobacter sp. CCS2 TaxID=391593 RepID=UPI0002FDDB13|nr:endonuclease/exonuclease/phosphatase family protein [Roseobacter sp. CCS2]